MQRVCKAYAVTSKGERIRGVDWTGRPFVSGPTGFRMNQRRRCTSKPMGLALASLAACISCLRHVGMTTASQRLRPPPSYEVDERIVHGGGGGGRQRGATNCAACGMRAGGAAVANAG